MSPSGQIPHNREAEEALVGVVLTDPEVLYTVMDDVEPQDFYLEQARLVWACYQDLLHLGVPVDIVTVSDRLGHKGELDRVGGSSWLVEVSALGVASSALYYARQVRAASILRRLGRTGQVITQEAHGGQFGPDAVIARAEMYLLNAAEAVQERQSPYASDLLVQAVAIDRMRAEALASGTPPDYIPCDGELKLADFFDGYFPGHAFLLKGGTSAGKTTFMHSMLIELEPHGERPVIFSNEDSALEKTNRLTAAWSNVAYRRIQKSSYHDSHEAIEAVDAARARLKKWDPIIYDDVRTVDEIIMKLKKHKLKDRSRVYVIDYVQNLLGDGNTNEIMRDAAARLFAAGKRHGFTAIWVSQVNDNETAAWAKEWENTADAIIMLKKMPKKPNEKPDPDSYTTAWVQKNRQFGPKGHIHCQFKEPGYGRIIRR